MASNIDEWLLKTQQWLNRTYGADSRFDKVPEDGITRAATVYGLLHALQIELGIEQTADAFGPGTQSRFVTRWPGGIRQQADGVTEESNVYAIIQGALWCKGYGAYESDDITRHFYGPTGKAIRALKVDMGIGGDSTVTMEIMMALLSMQQFKLIAGSGGKQVIREVQQQINEQYRSYTGIIPTDGLYGREMNTALIQVLQALEGFTPDEATGNFGNGTRSRLKTINASTAGANPKWVWLASAALVCNGYGSVVYSTWNTVISGTIDEFQNEYALPVSQSVDAYTWMSLLTSCGNPNRPAKACDTRFEITDEFAEQLKADGYEIVGRYLTEPGQESLNPADYFKAIRPGELERIVKHGLKYFPIFQEYSTKLTHFTPEAGKRHAQEAVKAAQRLGVPPTVIYFAVDMDVYEYQVEDVIVPYFKAIQDNLSDGYGVGIYASRNTCSIVSEHGYSISSFVSDMSTGFPAILASRFQRTGTTTSSLKSADTTTNGTSIASPTRGEFRHVVMFRIRVLEDTMIRIRQIRRKILSISGFLVWRMSVYQKWGLFLIRCMPIDLLLVSSFLNGFASQSTGLMAVRESSSCGIHILQSSAHRRKSRKLGRYA